MKNRNALLLLTFVAVTGCDGEPFTIGTEAASGAVTQAAAISSSDAIQAFIDAEVAAWAAKDPVAFAAGYSEDAQFYNPLGGLLNGREAIRAQHAVLFAGPFASSTLTTRIISIRYLTGTIAVVHAGSTTTGFGALPPGLNPTDPGVLQTVSTYVLVKRSNEWQAVAKQITAIP